MRNPLGLLLSYDVSVSTRFSQRIKRHQMTYLVGATLAHSGDGLLVMLVGAVVYAIGDRHLRVTLIQLLITLIVTAALVASLKYAIRRERPKGIDSARWSALPKYDRYSFPSGHAARVVAIAGVFGTAYPMIAWPVAIWAGAVSLARVAVGAHHMIDILGGFVCGVVVTAIVRAIIATL